MNKNIYENCIVEAGQIISYDHTKTMEQNAKFKKYHTDMMDNLFPQLKEEK